jgi:hypothetical protein
VLTPAETLAAYGPPPADAPADVAHMTEAELAALANTSADPAARAKAAQTLLARAHSGAEFAALAQVSAPGIAFALKGGAPIEDPVMFATAAAAAGDVATAQALRAGIEQGKAPDSDPLQLALLDAVIALTGDAPAGPVLDRLVERGAQGDPKLRARAQAAALLLQADGQPLSPQASAEFAGFDTPGPKASAERLAALARAGAQKHAGEAALLALSIAEQQPSGPTVADRALIVSALRQAGLGADARAVALEGVLQLMRP